MRSNFISCLVATNEGENPLDVINEFSYLENTVKQLKYKYKDKKKIYDTEIKLLKNLLKREDTQKEALQARLDLMNDIEPFDYYRMITDGLDIDEEGNAWEDVNPNGHFKFAKECKEETFVLPFKNKEGKVIFQAKKKDIAWDLIHMEKELVNDYSNAWDMLFNDKVPTTDKEKLHFKNISPYKDLYKVFPDKETFIKHNTSFFCFAFCQKNSWTEIDTNKIKDYEWSSNFYDKFIKPLDDETILTLYYCHI